MPVSSTRELQLDDTVHGFARDVDQHLAVLGEFHRVADEIGDDLAQAPGVADDVAGSRRSTARSARAPSRRRAPTSSVGHVLDYFAHVEIGAGSSVSFPASILEKSRMSLMMVSSASPDLGSRRRSVCWRGVSSVSSSSSAMPSTPFIGVRISWLILARNSDFARSAASALNRERADSAKACRMAFSIGLNTMLARCTWL